jgi:hypothetical protein
MSFPNLYVYLYSFSICGFLALLICLIFNFLWNLWKGIKFIVENLLKPLLFLIPIHDQPSGGVLWVGGLVWTGFLDMEDEDEDGEDSKGEDSSGQSQPPRFEELGDDLAEQNEFWSGGDEEFGKGYTAKESEGLKIVPRQTGRVVKEETERPQTPSQQTDDGTEMVDSVMKGQLDRQRGISTARDEGASPRPRPRHTRES